MWGLVAWVGGVREVDDGGVVEREEVEEVEGQGRGGA